MEMNFERTLGVMMEEYRAALITAVKIGEKIRNRGYTPPRIDIGSREGDPEILHGTVDLRVDVLRYQKQ